MILSLIIVLLIGAVAYFHYVQGLLSGTLSALMAVLAAVLAVGYHEPTAALLVGFMPDYAHAVALVGLFAVIYTVLRVMFDKLVPGNVRLPLYADRIGGAVMGVIAGVFATGVLAVAAQAMPFGPSVLGYSRYDLGEDRAVAVASTRGRQYRDAFVRNELAENTLEETGTNGLFLGVDEMLLGTVAYLSDAGSLAGARPLESIHPDYLDELFLNRLGIQTGARHTALNVAGEQQVTVTGVYAFDVIPAQADAEVSDYRVGTTPVTFPTQAPEGKVFLVVRTMFNRGAAEGREGVVHLSPGAVRLVAQHPEEGWTYYIPVGTLQDVERLYVNRPDDPLFVAVSGTQAGADFVFLVDEAAVFTDPGAADQVIADGVFIEAKRMAAVPLAGERVSAEIEPDPAVNVLRKPAAVQAATGGA